MKKRIKILIGSIFTIIGMTNLPLGVMAENLIVEQPCVAVIAEENLQFVQRADITGWRFKYIDGVLYKRLYNYTTKEWIGDWEKV